MIITLIGCVGMGFIAGVLVCFYLFVERKPNITRYELDGEIKTVTLNQN